MKQEMEDLKLKLEIQQYAARYLLKNYKGNLDDETIRELRGQMMVNRLGQRGLRSLNNQRRGRSWRKKERK